MEIRVYHDADASAQLDGLSDLLADAVNNGALVGYVLPLVPEMVQNYWCDVVGSVAAGGRVLICAVIGTQLVGTVQLYLSPEPNAPHRAEIYKLLVHSGHRRQGIGEALMLEVERQAGVHQRSVLLLDTVQGGAAERLYRRLGWHEIGIVPRHFVDPWGKPAASVYMMRLFDA